ncbi:hypothetical protein CYL18_11395 [Pradoshia eiseniae]|uniref:YlbE-like protein n=1 Tax=Pradoshia eiseniae TaxID=2064768 RepID=A0A2S7MYQ3_9BACI|nr:YlbE-like family protein [Pradoshia eiseniae]PQD94934.1 hypothetical protein CYL18_11395 [Pradoshia eiseniae]
MRQDVYEQIQGNEDLRDFLRQQPMWYRRLSRNPQDFSVFETESKYFFKKSIPDRVLQLSNSVQMASMMVSMFQSMSMNRGS